MLLRVGRVEPLEPARCGPRRVTTKKEGSLKPTMQTTEHSKETVEEAMRLLAAHRGNVSKVSRQMGIARSVITSWRDGTRRGADAGTAVAVAGVTPPVRSDVSQEPGVTRAARLVQKWDRSTNKGLDIVNRRLDQLDQKLKKGGTVTTDDVRGLKETAWVAAVGTDKISVLSGGATARMEHQVRISMGDDPANGKREVRSMSEVPGEWVENEGVWFNGDAIYVPDNGSERHSMMLPGSLERLSALVMADAHRPDEAIDTTGSVVEESEPSVSP